RQDSLEGGDELIADVWLGIDEDGHETIPQVRLIVVRDGFRRREVLARVPSLDDAVLEVDNGCGKCRQHPRRASYPGAARSRGQGIAYSKAGLHYPVPHRGCSEAPRRILVGSRPGEHRQRSNSVRDAASAAQWAPAPGEWHTRQG